MLKRLRKRFRDRNESKNYPDETDNGKFASLKKLKNLKITYIPYNELLKEGFFAGIGWAFGVTVGFVIISTMIVFILQYLGGLPLIGTWIANVVEETQNQLVRRTPVFSN